jgi:hypothetical protein
VESELRIRELEDEAQTEQNDLAKMKREYAVKHQAMQQIWGTVVPHPELVA